MSHCCPHKSRLSRRSPRWCIYIPSIYLYGSRLISIYPVTYLIRPPTSHLRSFSSPRVSYIVHSSLLYPNSFLFCLPLFLFRPLEPYHRWTARVSTIGSLFYPHTASGLTPVP